MPLRPIVVAIVVAVIVVAAVAAFMATQPAPEKEQIVIRWATSKPASAGYRAMTVLAKVVKEADPSIVIEPISTPGAVAGMKGFAKGEYDACYAADVSLEEMYKGIGRFEGFEAQRYPVLTVWVYTLEIGIAVPKERAGEFKCWKDLDGKRIFTLPLLWDVGVALRKALDALGIRYEHVELDLDAVATALERGDIVATGIYTSAGGRGLAGWERQLFIQTDLVILNPCPDEIEALRRAGIPIAEVPAEAFPEDVGVDKFIGVKIYYGFHTGLNIPEDVVYRLLKIIEENARKLAELDPSFSQIAEDMVGFQVEAIDALYAKGLKVPIHPGLARFLKEKGVWKDEWIVASS
jgi:TRAP transporter TAXI family solute receptor